MKIKNITDKGVRPSKVDVVVNFNKSPKTFTLEPGQFIYVPGEFNFLITQAMRVQKQRGLIDFTDENETVENNVVLDSNASEVLLENQTEITIETGEDRVVDIFDLSLEDVQKEEEKEEVEKEESKKERGRPKGSYKLSSRIREAMAQKSQKNDK
jgi:hypothetical protein